MMAVDVIKFIFKYINLNFLSLILILIAYYFDYKSEPDSFWSDIKGGLTVFGVLIAPALILKYKFNIGHIYIIFAIGIEIILLFVLKGFLKK